MSFPASIPLRRDPPEGAGADGADFSAMAVLGLLLVAAVFAWTWWRKRRATHAQTSTSPGSTAAAPSTPPAWGRWLGLPAAREVRTLGSTRLTAKHSVHEVQWQGRRLLIGCADQAICLLAEAPVDPGSPIPPVPPVAPVAPNSEAAEAP